MLACNFNIVKIEIILVYEYLLKGLFNFTKNTFEIVPAMPKWVTL